MSETVTAVDYVNTKDKVVDPLTKGLDQSLVQKSGLGMGLKPINDASVVATQPTKWRSHKEGSMWYK